MHHFQELIPIFACAIVIGLRWRRTTDTDATIYNIKKKHWYAILEFTLLITAVALIIKNLN
jgi:hypothetical protein